MDDRSFSMAEYWNSTAKKYAPAMSYKRGAYQDVRSWRNDASKKLFELLGRLPKETGLDDEIVGQTEERGIIRENVLFNFDSYLAVKCNIFKPVANTVGKRYPALIYCPDGSLTCPGKNETENNGVHDSADIPAWEKTAEKLAGEGLIVAVPNFSIWCNNCVGVQTQGALETYCVINFFKGALIGFYPITMNLWFIKRCLDYMDVRSDVEVTKIGISGEGYGGMLAAISSALDERIKVTCITAYYEEWKDFYIKGSKSCGASSLPYLLKYYEFADILGLTAPKPLLLQLVRKTIQDGSCLPGRIKDIYCEYGYPEAFEYVIREKKASYVLPETAEFLKKHLSVE